MKQPEKNKAVIGVLKQRADVLRKVLKSLPFFRRLLGYYRGKLEGYEQAIDLLHESLESINVELEENEHRD